MKQRQMPETLEEAQELVAWHEQELRHAKAELNRFQHAISRDVCSKDGHDWTPESMHFKTTCKRCGCHK